MPISPWLVMRRVSAGPTGPRRAPDRLLVFSATVEIQRIMPEQGVRPGGVRIGTTNGLTTLTVSYQSAAADEAAALVESRKVAKALWERACCSWSAWWS
jgi:hypothetical protein